MAELVSIKRNVDVSPGQAAPAVFHCSQGDVGSKIILGLLNNGTAYSIPSGVTVTIEGSESNGSIFTPISATASGSDITFYLTGEMTAVAGPAICQAVLKSGSNILGTANFTLEVESSPMGADAPPVFTDAGWTWMLNKLNTEFVPALDDNIIDAIGGKLDKNQGTANAGKYLKVGTNGNVETADLDVTTDKTLSIADKAADAKAVGDELNSLKADLNAANDLTTYVMDDSYLRSSINYDGYDSNRALTATGKEVVTGSVILSFPVTAGTLLKVSLKNRTGGNILYFFQDTKSVPWDGNTHIIGNINYGDRFVGYIYVPTRATYLVTNADISEIASDVSNVKPAAASALHDDNKIILSDVLENAININNLSWTYGSFINENGVITPGDPLFKYSDFIPLDNGEYYIYARKILSGAGKNVRVHGYDSSGNWVKQLLYFTPYTFEAEKGWFEIDNTVTKIRISSSDYNEIVFLVNDIALTSKIMKFRKQLTSEDDMDHIALPGMYFVNLDNPPAHFPSEEMGVNVGRFRVLVNKSADSENHYGEFQLISGEKNLYFRTGSYSGNLQPWNIVYGHRSQRNKIQSEAIMLGLHVVPENRGVLNAIKRARQQTDIKWTSGDDIPRGFLETGDTYESSHYAYLGTYKEGVEYTGLPYSEEHYLANDYSIDAFVTSAANPRSAMILESTGQSASYACYYGTVCTNLTSYALNIPTVDSYNWTKIDGISTVGMLSSVNPKNLALCDILQIDGHCAIITDIISDENDNIILIEISEATKFGNINRTVTDGQFGGLSRRITMTVEKFYTWFDGFKVLRYAYLSTIPYCPNPYSPMADEGKPLAYVDFPCVPYLGNKISLTTEGNRQIKILINNNLYTHLVVKKDGVAWNQDGTTNPYNIEGLDEVTITCDNGFGIYTAHMATFSNGTEATATVSCSWAIRPAITASVSVSNNKAVFTSTLKGKEFTPWFVTFGASSDDTFGKIRDGEAIKVFDIYEVTDNEDGTYTYTFTVDYPQTNPTHARLGIRSDEYGSGSKDFTI